jgi:hypothetical protein
MSAPVTVGALLAARRYRHCWVVSLRSYCPRRPLWSPAPACIITRQVLVFSERPISHAAAAHEAAQSFGAGHRVIGAVPTPALGLAVTRMRTTRDVFANAEAPTWWTVAD